MTDVRITVRNTSDTGGTFLTPFYAGFHNGSFDLFTVGEQASGGLESIAEDGMFAAAAAERLEADPDSQGVVVTGAAGPIATGEVTSQVVTLSPTQTHLTLAAMILPSNDAFVGTDDALMLFDENGRFNGAQTVVFEGSDVYDAGTEVNTELDAAFINQAAPNTGIDEVFDEEAGTGFIRQHDGFNGSAGNPEGEGDQIILGGTNAFGVDIDPVAADFTLPGAQIAEVHVNTVVVRDGSDQRDVIIGRSDDDIVSAGNGGDFVRGGRGFDVIDGGDGRDKLFGNAGDDEIYGGNGRDWISGGSGRDAIDGGAGKDFINAGSGDDLIAGGADNDVVRGGLGDDTFLFADGDGFDKIIDFDRTGDDQIALSVAGVTSFADVEDAASQAFFGVRIAFGDGDGLFLLGSNLSSLGEDDFVFV